jgi:hypothetical protein
MKARSQILVLLTAVLLLVASARAQDYAIDWHTIDGGGGTSSGGTYTLSGTIGQPDAGTMTGGDYTLQGGFWPGLVVTATGEVPTLFIKTSGTGVSISWSPATPGFTLEETDNLSVPSWGAAPGGNPANLPASGATRFFRLKRP